MDWAIDRMAVGAERVAVTDGYHPATEVASRQSSAAARTTGRQRAEERERDWKR